LDQGSWEHPSRSDKQPLASDDRASEQDFYPV
jgi:hypothetical protein